MSSRTLPRTDLGLPQFKAVRFHQSIGFVLNLIFLLLAIVPSALFAVLTINRANSEARERATNQLQSVAETKIVDIERWVRTGQSALQLVLVEEKEEWTESLAEGHTEEFVAAEGAELQERVALQEVFTEFFLYDAEGEIMLSSNVNQVGKSVRLQPYYDHSLASNHLQPPYYEVVDNTLNMVISTPLKTSTGQTVGVFAGRVNVDTLSVIMENRVGMGRTGETYLVSLENNYFVTPSLFEGYSQTEAYHSLGIDRALAGETGQGVYDDYRGVPVIGVYRWLPSLEMALLAEIDDAEALEAGRDLRSISLIAAIVVTILALIVGIGATNWLNHPLQTLTRSAAAVASGDYQQRAAINSNNEIGQLAHAFNAMTDQLVQKIGELDRRLKEIDETNKALKIATNKAKEAARLKSEFLSTMSHELRTPLNAMEGFTTIMLSKMGGAEYNDKTEYFLQRINVNNKRLLQLINDFLDLSRIESGRMELASVAFAPQQMVKKWQEQMVVLAEAKGLAFDVQVDPALPETLYGDEEAISKIALNLLSNAIKFTEQGKVSLVVDYSGETWAIKVEDTGIGIPPHAREYIFEEFRQVDQSSKRKYGGTGLGLAIVQKLARLMNGSVNLRSEVGVGSVFTLTLPAETEAVLV